MESALPKLRVPDPVPRQGFVEGPALNSRDDQSLKLNVCLEYPFRQFHDVVLYELSAFDQICSEIFVERICGQRGM